MKTIVNKLNTKLRYSLYAVLALVFLSLTSCDTMEAESEYNKRSWEIKKMKLELEYLKELHRYRDDLEFEQKMADIDSLIQNYRQLPYMYAFHK